MRQPALRCYSARIASRQQWPCQQSITNEKYCVTNPYNPNIQLFYQHRVLCCIYLYSQYLVLPQKTLLLCRSGILLTNTKLFAHVFFLFSIPRQQFGKSWMNTKVMKWRFMHRANIWQGQFSSWLFLLPAKNSAWVLNLWILLLHAGCGTICKGRLILKENWSVSLPEENQIFWFFGGLLLAHTKKPANILQSIPQMAFLVPKIQR